MEKAKISELRDRLSYYLRRVREGESIEILDRKDPVARLIPVPAASEASQAWVRRLQRAGTVNVGRMQGVRALLDKKAKREPPSGVLQTLLEERKSGR